MKDWETMNRHHRSSDIIVLPLIIKCILFSFLSTVVFLLWTQPKETQLFFHESIVPHVKTIRQIILHTLASRPVVYDLTHQLQSSSSCYNLYNHSYLSEETTTTRDCDEKKTILSHEIKQAYENDGVVAIRGLISPQLLTELDQASKILISREKDRLNIKGNEYSSGKQFQTKKMGPIFDLDENLSGFRHAALTSLLPQVVAELLDLTDVTVSNATATNVRVLRDVFLAKDEGQYICGWHVDDWGFWPASASSDGVNVWIAIDDMPDTTGGGFALSVGSHRADWRQEAYEIIGATPTIPEDGFQSAEDMFMNRKGYGTCNLKTAAPHLNDLLEENMRVYNLKAGDVIFHTRWLFHRTVPFHPKIVRDYYRKLEDPSISDVDPLLYRRYTIRYAPGHATLPKGYVTELSILWNPDNAGRTLDDVSTWDAPWYPKCYPSIDPEELLRVNNLVETKLPIATARRKERYKEMKPFLHEIGQRQREMLRLNSHGLQGIQGHSSNEKRFHNGLKDETGRQHTTEKEL